MIREPMARRDVGRSPGFRWRGGDVSRLEGFSDAVFGFSLTLLVVSLEVPATFSEIMGALARAPVFTICFGILAWVWYRHYLFFRRYGLQDTYTIFLNTVLLFVVLLYVYPLKFMYGVLVQVLTGHGLAAALPGGGTEPMIRVEQVPLLFIVFGGGFAAVFAVFGLLYVHAYRLREELDLSPGERVETLETMLSSLVLAGLGACSVAIAAAGGTRIAPWVPSLPFWFVPVAEAMIGLGMGIRRRRLETEASPAAAPGPAAEEDPPPQDGGP